MLPIWYDFVIFEINLLRIKTLIFCQTYLKHTLETEHIPSNFLIVYSSNCVVILQMGGKNLTNFIKRVICHKSSKKVAKNRLVNYIRLHTVNDLHCDQMIEWIKQCLLGWVRLGWIGVSWVNFIRLHTVNDQHCDQMSGLG